ncbi:MAG: hypothetical protein HQ542_14220, partial [Bacteroidia bacterium]|nr:hypothetical protein [Bacteroidia bacterium]
GWALPAVTVGNTTGGVFQAGNGTIKASLESGSTWGYARLVSSDADGFGQGNLYFQVDRVGIGDASPSAKLHVETTGSEQTGFFQGNGTGLSYVTLKSENISTSSGIAGYFKTQGTDVTLALDQDGTGPILKCFGPNGGEEEVRINGDGYTTFYNQDHEGTIILQPDDIYTGAELSLYNGNGTRTIYMEGNESGSTDGSQIRLYNSSGVATIEIDGDYNDDGRVTTQELEITGGSDLAELFDIQDDINVTPGMVLSIDPDHPGALKISEKAYDPRVAGIVSGANNISTGLIMSDRGSVADGEHLVALTGRVYCLVDASNGSIKPGDLLTTSSTPGHAMKVVNKKKAQGAIIGKAMTVLESGKGLVLVLVSLQ